MSVDKEPGSSGDSSVHSLYEKREKIFTRSMEGFYQKIRAYTGWPLLLGYFLIPWFTANEHQAVLFDLPARQFHIFWLTFWPQDFSLLAWALMIAAFSLFFVTNLLDRLERKSLATKNVYTDVYVFSRHSSVACPGEYADAALLRSPVPST